MRKYREGTSILFGADQHFFFKNIATSRHMSLEEMHETLIYRWNLKAKPDSKVFILGDFMKWSGDESIKVIRELQGTIYLVPGSHDKDLVKKIPLINDTLKCNKIILLDKQELIRVGTQPVELSHCPQLVWELSHYGGWHLFGHCHGWCDPIGKSHDVGADPNQLELLEWEDIGLIMATRPDNINLVDKEHNRTVKWAASVHKYMDLLNSAPGPLEAMHSTDFEDQFIEWWDKAQKLLAGKKSSNLCDCPKTNPFQPQHIVKRICPLCGSQYIRAERSPDGCEIVEFECGGGLFWNGVIVTLSEWSHCPKQGKDD